MDVLLFGTASSSKLDILKENGVDYPIDYTKQDFYTEIHKILGGHKLDFAFDSVGGRSFKNSYKLLLQSGKIVTFGGSRSNFW